MSQEQCQRPQQEAIKYGDVFTVQGELAEKTVTPRDAAMMQTAENAMLGHTQKVVRPQPCSRPPCAT
ncbi:hypothetical protein SLA2020_335340 [Shorea laevis]